MDVFAIVAAFGIAFTLTQPLRVFRARARAAETLSSFRPSPVRPSQPPQVRPGDDLTDFLVATPLALFMVQPLAIASQFAFRRRRMRPLRLELVGAFPGCVALAMITFLIALASEAHPALVAVLLVVIFSGCCAGIWLFCFPGDRVRDVYAWTDWLGVAMIVVSWFMFAFISSRFQ
jgi:hypothetical protein